MQGQSGPCYAYCQSHSPQKRCLHFVKALYTGVAGLAGALASLQRLGRTCDLVVVTSRQHCIRQQTLEWIQLHYPQVFSDIQFGNHWALQGTSRTKSEICRSASVPCLDYCRAYLYSLLTQSHPHGGVVNPGRHLIVHLSGQQSISWQVQHLCVMCSCSAAGCWGLMLCKLDQIMKLPVILIRPLA